MKNTFKKATVFAVVLAFMIPCLASLGTYVIVDKKKRV